MERSNSLNLAVISGTICLLFSTPTLWADIINGDFSSGLSNWKSYGVSIFDKKAIFYEGAYDDTYPSYPQPEIFYLEQLIDIEAGLQLLSFDISIDSVEVEIEPETDYFNVFLYGNEIHNKIHKWDSADPLIVPETTWTYYCPFPKKDVLLRFELDFDYLPNPLETDAFTRVTLDNVKLTPVPGAVVLGSMGLSFAGWMLRRKKT